MTVAATTYLDAPSEAYVADVLEEIDGHVPILEAYLLGSGVVGGFDPKTSDIDLVVVVASPLGSERDAVVQRLRGIPCPVRDLQLVVYVEGAQPPHFELNVNEGVERPEEDGFWFVLDAALAQERAVPLRGDRPWSDFFQPVSRERVRSALAESIAWSERQAPDDEFALMNAIRARHYLEHGEWISKGEAGR
jgi:predicted nucleotidyltransferase